MAKSISGKSLMNGLLVICVILGFVCLAQVYLPSKLEGISNTSISKPRSQNLLALLPQQTKADEAQVETFELADGTKVRFVPELNPSRHLFVARKGEDLKKPSPTNYSGLNVAPNPALTRTHKMSSLALYDPAHLAPKDKKGRSIFHIPPPLEMDVAFWRDIYSKYDSHHAVLHDMKYLTVVYSVLDFTDLDANTSISGTERSHMKKERISAEKKRIISILDWLSKNPTDNNISSEIYKIKNLYSGIRGKDKFKEAKERGVRVQTGLKDKFIAGLKYSGRYLGEIESIFERLKLPRELTFLIFVESMFNPRAHSSAGASGIWQFMPQTAKVHHLKIDPLVDERRDPIRATYAAASLLRRNYESLGTWPLAINAYNAGRGRLQQAVKQLGTTDISMIVRRFKHPAYGFASRNFYVEFLAAMEVAKNYNRYFGTIEFDHPLSYDAVSVNRPISLPKVAKHSDVPIALVKELNPGYSNSVYAGKYALPLGFELRMPKKKGEHFLAIASQMSQIHPIIHIAQVGETLNDIAQMYGVSVPDILRANKRIRKHLLPGQEVLIQR